MPQPKYDFKTVFQGYTVPREEPNTTTDAFVAAMKAQQQVMLNSISNGLNSALFGPKERIRVRHDYEHLVSLTLEEFFDLENTVWAYDPDAHYWGVEVVISLLSPFVTDHPIDLDGSIFEEIPF